MPTRILVISYSQTGQLDRLLDSVLRPIKNKGVHIDHLVVEPIRPYPFPWGRVQFFNEFPESVYGIATPLKPIGIDPSAHYDLIILGYTVWYLNPSIPINSFLKTDEAKALFRNKPVITIIGARNMWVLAQEKVRATIAELGGRVVGNVSLIDHASNLVSIVTVIRWMFYGKKEATAVLPRAGISDADIENAAQFGQTIANKLAEGSFDGIGNELRNQGGAHISPSLLVLEKRASKLFGMYAKFILAKGEHDNPARLGRVNLLSILLPLGAFILSPITSLTTTLVSLIKKKELEAEADKLLTY